MADLHARQATLRGWLRLLSVLGLTVGALLFIYQRAPGEEAMAVLPWVCCAFAAFLAPIFVSENTGLFSPPGIVGLNGALATAAIMAQILRDGGVTFDVLGVMSEEQRVDLGVRAALLILVAHLAYLVGYFGSTGNVASRFFPAVAGRRWHGGRLLVSILVTALLVVPFYYLFQRRLGGSLIDITDLGRGKEVLKDDPTLSWMVRGIMLAFIPTLLLAGMAIVDRSRWLLAFTGVVFLFVSALVTRLGPRQPALFGAQMILILFNYLWRKVSPSLVVVALLVAVVGVDVLGSYRAPWRERVEFSKGMASPMEAMARHEDDRNRLQVLGILLHYFPEREDYLLGSTYAALTVSWIPRWVWPQKTDYFENGNRIVFRLTGLPAPVPLHGELYANFSWFGVVIGMALFGAFHRGLSRYREASPRDVGVALIYASVATQFTPTSMGISAAAQYVLPLTVLIYFVSRREPALGPASEARDPVPV
jgi:hypothetical protein